MDRLEYSREEILADHDYARRIRFDGKLFHGGYTADGDYRSPRTLHREPAVRAWQRRLEREGQPYRIVPRDIVPPFFPSVAQTRLLIAHGVTEPVAFILTSIGIVEGFGNVGLRSVPALDYRKIFVEDLTGTCLDHLHRGLLEAHGMDEAGNDAAGECGHDEMWYTVRDLAFDHPTLSDEYKAELPNAPGKSAPGGDRSGPLAGPQDILRNIQGGIPPLLQIVFRALTGVLVIELFAEATFEWAKAVLGDSSWNGRAEDCRRIVECIQRDEQPHVGYLETALAEARARTIRGLDGKTYPGAPLVDAVVADMISVQTGARIQALRAHRLGLIEKRLGSLPNGAALIEEFRALGKKAASAA